MKREILKKFFIVVCLVFALQTILTPFVVTEVKAATVKLNKSSLTLVEGKSATLKMTGSSGKVTWSTSKKEIATVSNGKVKAIKVGTATITAKVGKTNYKCKVTVVPKFDKSKYVQSLRESLIGRYIDVSVNGNTQTILIDSNDVISFKIDSAKMNSLLNEVDVVATMVIDRTVAKVDVEANCKYTLVKNKWNLKTVTMKTSLSDINIEGVWKGSYYLNRESEVALEFTITNVTEDGYANAEFYFYAPPTNPKIPTGRYTMRGGIDYTTGKISFIGVEWIDNPAGWGFIDVNGQIDVTIKGITANNQMRLYPPTQ